MHVANHRHDLELMLRAHTPVIVIETRDESRVLDLLKNVVCSRGSADYVPLYRWSITDGLQRLDVELPPQQHNAQPGEVLKHIRAVTKPGLYALLDFHPYLDDPVNVRLIKDVCLRFAEVPRHLVLISHRVDLPAELRGFAARFELALPSDKERAAIVRRAAAEWNAEHKGSAVRIDPKAHRMLIRNLAGLTDGDTERLARGAIFDDGAITQSDLPGVMQAKYELLNAGGVLHFEYDTRRFSDVGGLERLKQWLTQRRVAFTLPAPHLDPPKGVLLIGVQGCGKSLAAKATAGIFGIPLLRLDFGSLYNKYHGETERNLRESLRTADVMAPCVLWIDEIEKGVATGDGDSGTSRRLLGTFLTWLAEKKTKVFVVATANDISSLPPELIRKGRFDEIFFVDLPGAAVRADILKIHSKKRDLTLGDEDIERLAAACAGFSGAEIEQAIVSAVYAAHADNARTSAAHVLHELNATRPLSIVMAERIAELRAWAKERTVQAE